MATGHGLPWISGGMGRRADDLRPQLLDEVTGILLSDGSDNVGIPFSIDIAEHESMHGPQPIKPDRVEPQSRAFGEEGSALREHATDHVGTHRRCQLMYPSDRSVRSCSGVSSTPLDGVKYCDRARWASNCSSKKAVYFWTRSGRSSCRLHRAMGSFQRS